MSEPYVTIPNWNRFQHYHDGRAPAWIKTYLALLSNDDYLDLSAFDRGVLHGVWLVSASDTQNARCDDANYHAKASLRRCRAQLNIPAGHLQRSLKRLQDKGWLHFHLDNPYQKSRDSVPNPGHRTEEKRKEVLLKGQSEKPKGQKPDHEDITFDLKPIQSNLATLTPERPQLSTIPGELGIAVDRLLHICHDKDTGTPKVIDSLARRTNLAAVIDAIEAIKATSPHSPTRYAVRVLQTHQGAA